MKFLEGTSSHYRLMLEKALQGEKMTCPDAGPNLRGHIAKQHFSPGILAWMGVAKFDLELAALKGLNMDWAVKKAYERLENGWAGHEAEFQKPRTVKMNSVFNRDSLPWDENWPKIFLVKNLKYIEQLNLSVIDWDRVTKIIALTDETILDIEKDAHDPDFPEPKKIYTTDLYLPHLRRENTF